MKGLLLLAAAVVVLLIASGAGVFEAIPELRDRASAALRGESDGQGAAQISSSEFVRVRRGVTVKQLRELVGEPESSAATTVEGLRLECVYYGIVGASGAYQFCFANGRLVSRYRFARS